MWADHSPAGTKGSPPSAKQSACPSLLQSEMGQASSEVTPPLLAFRGPSPTTEPLLEGVKVAGPQRSDEFIRQEQCDAGFEGHGSDVTT